MERRSIWKFFHPSLLLIYSLPRFSKVHLFWNQAINTSTSIRLLHTPLHVRKIRGMLLIYFLTSSTNRHEYPITNKRHIPTLMKYCSEFPIDSTSALHVRATCHIFPSTGSPDSISLKVLWSHKHIYTVVLYCSSVRLLSYRRSLILTGWSQSDQRQSVVPSRKSLQF